MYSVYACSMSQHTMSSAGCADVMNGWKHSWHCSWHVLASIAIAKGELLQHRSCTCKSGNTNNGIDIWIKPLLPSGSPYHSCHWIGRSTIHVREWSSSLLSPLILHGSCLELVNRFELTYDARACNLRAASNL